MRTTNKLYALRAWPAQWIIPHTETPRASAGRAGSTPRTRPWNHGRLTSRMADASFEPVLSARPSMKMRWPRDSGLRLRAYARQQPVRRPVEAPPAGSRQWGSLTRALSGRLLLNSGFRLLAVAQQA
jgi:hypothetical protein